MCFWSHETTAYARPMEEEEEQRDFRSACQSGAGTARYDSASSNSVGSSCLGEVGELRSELESGVEERKLRSGVKS